jgi:hypothetical protein
MKKLISVTAIALGMLAGQAAFAANPACDKQADEKKLAGAARTSFLKKCERDTGAGAACEATASEKKLAGAARTSFMKKCVADAAAAKK